MSDFGRLATPRVCCAFGLRLGFLRPTIGKRGDRARFLLTDVGNRSVWKTSDLAFRSQAIVSILAALFEECVFMSTSPPRLGGRWFIVQGVSTATLPPPSPRPSLRRYIAENAGIRCIDSALVKMM